MKKEVENTKKQIENMEIIDFEKLDNNIYTNFDKRDWHEQRQNIQISLNTDDSLAKRAKISPAINTSGNTSINTMNNSTGDASKSMPAQKFNTFKKNNNKKHKQTPSPNKPLNTVFNYPVQSIAYQPRHLPLNTSGLPDNNNLITRNFTNLQNGLYSMNNSPALLSYGNLPNPTNLLNFSGFNNTGFNFQSNLMASYANRDGLFGPRDGFNFNNNVGNENGLNNLLNLISTQLGNTGNHQNEMVQPLMNINPVVNNGNIIPNNPNNNRGIKRKNGM